jgi:CubicO group peptidase (beta-lactamase class C family)
MKRITLAASLMVFAGGAVAAELPTAPPQSVGLSQAALERMEQVLLAEIERGDIPGVVVLVARNGKVAYQKALGLRDKEASAPMQDDAIFRIYSMTKPITSVAAMMLHEEGKLLLQDRVSKFLPELKDMKVGVEKTDGAGNKTLELVPAKPEMTIQDLMRHTSGLTYGNRGRAPELVRKAWTEAGERTENWTSAEFITMLSKLPLGFQPGTQFEYGRSTDVLGRVVEVVSGQPLDRFFEERIFAKLDMKDTFFDVPEEKLARVAEPQVDKATGKRPTLRDPRKKAVFHSGGGGLYSTARDYARFAQMLLNGGELDGVRLISKRTVEFMMADHLGALPGTNYPGHGFGLGFAVRTAAGVSPWYGTPGEVHWGGAGGTMFWIDPKEKLHVTFMSQAPGEIRLYYRGLIKSLIAQAILD